MSQLLDMMGSVEVVPENDGGDLFPLDLSTLAVSSLIDEAELTPKPALVDRRGNGAHHDLDLTRLRRSAQSLQDGFAAIARAADGEEPSLRLREELGRIGRDMERRHAGGDRWQQRTPRRDLGARLAGRRCRPAPVGDKCHVHRERGGRPRTAAGQVCPPPPAEQRRAGPLAIRRGRCSRRGAGGLPACDPRRPAGTPRGAWPWGA